MIVLHAPEAARHAALEGSGASIKLEVGRPPVTISGRVERAEEVTYRRSGP
ncbi:MAG: hypothetical protein OXG37_04950 [Actinomycetia bacterium]|nr:hypothetical protein [Actinomycetes bacterium]